MSWFKRKPPAPPPRPSDILAGLVSARMISTPERVKVKLVSPEYGMLMREARWEDPDTEIIVLGKTGRNQAFSSWMYGCLQSFTYRGRELSPTSEGALQLRRAFDLCLSHQEGVAEAKRQYNGDMAACDAIQEMSNA